MKFKKPPTIGENFRWNIRRPGRLNDPHKCRIIDNNADWHDFWDKVGQTAPGPLPAEAIAVFMVAEVAGSAHTLICYGPEFTDNTARYGWFSRHTGGPCTETPTAKAVVQLVPRPAKGKHLQLTRIASVPIEMPKSRLQAGRFSF